MKNDDSALRLQQLLEYVDFETAVYERSTGNDEYRNGALFALLGVRARITGNATA